MPKAKTTTHGLKFLTYEGNHIWNSLPMHINNNDDDDDDEDNDDDVVVKNWGVFYYVK